MTLENNREPLLYYIKLCVSFQSHAWIQTGVTVRKRSIRVKIGSFLSCVTLKFNGWPWKTVGHLFYTTSSFVHHFKSMGEFKVELQSGNAQFGSKSAIYLMDDLAKRYGTSSILHQALCIISNPWVNSNWSYSPETLNSGQNRQFFVLCHLEIWWMTLENNRAPLLYYISFVHHFKSMGEFKLELQSGNAQFRTKSVIFCPVWPWNLTDDLEKQ